MSLTRNILERPFALLAALVVIGVGVGRATAEPSPDAAALRKECEYGIALALAGRTAGAESTFISLLSHAPGDPRALTNLGNLSFLRGDPEVALAFYDRALLGDSTDAGIRLNRAITYLGLGETERAQAEAAKGREMAGSSRAAQRLVGIRYAGDYPKASELTPRAQIPGRARDTGRKVMVRKEEIRALLGTGDTRASRADRGEPAGPEREGSGVRSAGAGTKASDEGNAATLLYWKR